LNGLLDYSARVLAVRSQTTAEMRGKLLRRAADRNDVDEALRRLAENGFLNDQKLAESFANWRRDNEGFGKHRVLRDLLARRIAPEVARKAADSAYSATDENAMIRQYLERKFRGKDLHELLQEEKHLASAYRRLRTAGFSSAGSIRVLKGYASQAEDLGDLEETPPE